MSFGREVASVLLKVVAVVLTIVILVGMLFFTSLGALSISDGTCNVAVFPVEGVIMPFGTGAEYGEFATTPRDLRDFIAILESELFIDAVLFEINSPGGTPVAAEMMAADIDALTLPTYALVGDVAASGGYLVAAATDKIVASPMSDVGSIGVTMSYLEESEKLAEEGITYVELNSGTFKDIGSPYKPLTDEERTLLETQLTEIHEYFVSLISQYRELDTEKVKTLADGSTLTGTGARDAGLVDELGGRAKVKELIATDIGLTPEEVSFCEFYELPLL